MCGRYTRHASWRDLVGYFRILDDPGWNLQPRYNVAPTQEVLIVRIGDEGREFARVRWGLIPHWAKDKSIGIKLINARGETVAEKPSFRDSFKKRRCLVIADGFYEWAKEGGKKQPHLIRLKSQEPIAFAGLWSSWTDKQDGSEVETDTIITTEANELLAPLHNRMPVILSPGDYDRWLDSYAGDGRELLQAYPSERMEQFPVSTLVNNVRNDERSLIEPFE